MGAHKRFALVGIEFARQAPAQDGFLEGVVERLGVGRRIIRGEGDEKSMPIILIKQL